MVKLPLTGWERFLRCPECDAAAAQPCRKLFRKPGAPVTFRKLPHPSRRRPRVRAYFPRENLSRLGTIVVEVMYYEQYSVPRLAAASGYTRGMVYRLLRETDRPLNVKQVDRLLAAMGYKLQHRAVPLTTAAAPAAGDRKVTP